MVYKIRNLVVLSLIIVCLTLCGCQSQDTNVQDENNPEYTYTSQTIDLYKPDKALVAHNAIFYNDDYYLLVQEFNIDSDGCQNYLVKMSDNGDVVSELAINNNINPYVSSTIVDNQFLYVTFSKEAEAIDINTGNLIMNEQHDRDLCGVMSCDDGYVLMSIGQIDKYSKNNELISTITNDDWQFYNGHRTFYQVDNHYYLLPDSSWYWKYYELDFDNRSSRLIYDPTQEGKELMGCSGPYVFDSEGEFLLDFENSQSIPLAYWNDVNLQPAQYTYSEPEYIGINNERFLQIYNYDSGIAQIVVYTYDKSKPQTEKKQITVGGFNCNRDLSLNWAVYKFNCSQDEYRVYIDDYSDKFGWDSVSNAAVQYAELIKYFNEGNAPDIFYGDYFDYDSFYESGMTVDMCQYMDTELQDKIDGITENIKQLMFDDENHCYRLFSSYQIEDYMSDSDLVAGDVSLSIDDVVALSDKYNVKPYVSQLSCDIADQAIKYMIYDKKNLDVDSINTILKYAYDYGVEDVNDFTYDSLSSVNVDDYLLWNIGIYSPMQLNELEIENKTRFTHVGYPSIAGSYHVIRAFGQVAISASSECPEECTRFIAHLLDDDVQQLCNTSCFIPVEDKCLMELVNYSQDHSLIPEDNFSYRMYFVIYKEVSADAAEDFLNSVHSIDTVLHFDWGISDIVQEETAQYYEQGKEISEISDSLYSRINVYLAEEGY